jgi:hypothetical protein
VAVVNQGLEPQVSASDPASNSTINPRIPVAHLEQNATVSYLHHCSGPLLNQQPGLLANTQNLLITG